MTPEEKVLLESTHKLSEQNNKMLRGLQRAQRWATFWGFIKFLLIVVPLILGYLYLQPYLDGALKNFQNVQSLLKSY